MTDIRISSAVKAFFTNSFVLFAVGLITLGAGMSLVVISAGLALPIITLIVKIAGIAISGLGGGIMGFTIENSLNREKLLPKISVFFQNRADQANILINQIKQELDKGNTVSISY